MDQHIDFMLLGLANGAVFAALALALVVTFRSSGVINFATGTIALFGAYVYAFLRQGKLLLLIPGLPQTVQLGGGLGFVPAVAITLVMSALLGLALYGSTFRPLRAAPPVAKAVASVGVMVVISGVILQRVGTNPISVTSIFPTNIYQLGSIHVSADRLWFSVTVIGMTLAVMAGFRFTRFGLHTRAAAESEKGAYISHISPDRIAALNWMISAVIAGMAGILISPISPLVPYSYTLFIVPALAAAIVGGFQRLGLAVGAGLVIGMLQSEVAYLQARYSWLPQSGLPELVPLLLILVVLVFRAKPLPSRGSLVRTTLGRAPRPNNLTATTIFGAALGLLAIFALHGPSRSALVSTFALGIVSLSIVVITGFAGQVSLAQLTLAGVAGFLLSTITTDWGVPFPIAPILAAVGATALGVVVGLPALRIRGLPVAIVTLSLAVAIQALWFQNIGFVGASGQPVVEPKLFGLSLGPGTGADFPRPQFCVMVLVFFLLSALGVALLRRSRLGSAMLAVRANERSAAASGINVMSTKIAAFAIAAFIAGIGGSMMGYQLGTVTFDPFDVLLGLGLFASVYLAGITSVSGGVVAGVLAGGGLLAYAMSAWFSLSVAWYEILTGIGLIVTVITNPEGIVGNFHHMIDRWRARRAATFPIAATNATAVPAPMAVPDLARLPDLASVLDPPGVPDPAGVPDPPGVPDPANVSPLGERVRLRPVESPSQGEASPILTVRDLCVKYGAIVAVDSVSFDVFRHEILGLIGPNGAGKTTVIDAISGFSPYSGSVSLDGTALDQLAPFRRIRRQLGRTFQGIELWDDLTVAENVLVGPGATQRSKEDIDALFALLRLDGLRNRPASELSQGQRQLASIARSLIGNPKVVLLDEPAAGLDSKESEWLSERLCDIRDSGITVLLVDHDMNLVLNLCDRIEVLDQGCIIASGPPAAIRSNREVADAYLGTAHFSQEPSLR